MNCIWKKSKIGDVLKVQGGYAFSSETFVDGGVPLVRISNIVNTKIVDRSPVYLPKQYLLEFSNYAGRECDTLIAMSGATTGKTAFVRQIDLPFLINQRVGRFLISDNEAITKEYLFYLVSNDEFLNEVLIDSAGGAQPNISSYDIERIEFYRPPLPQQQKIAKILTTVDNLIEQTQALIDKYTVIKQGMIADLFTRGIDLSGTPETNPNHGQLRPSFEEAPELYKETELGWVPREWEVFKIGDLSVNGFKNGYFKDPRLLGEGKKLVNVTELYQSFGIDISLDKVERIKITEKDFNKYGVEIGDLFFTRSSLVLEGIAKSNIVRSLPEPAVFECHVMRLRPNTKLIEPEYLALFCETDESRRFFMSMAKQVTMTTIAQPDMTGLKVRTPSLLEQIGVVQKFNGVNDLINDLVIEKEKYKSIKKGLMQDLLTGKVQVTA